MMHAIVPCAILLVAFGLYTRSLLRWKARARGLPLPPGPIGWPFVGNWFDMPAFKPWLGFRDMRARYGECTRTTGALNQDLTILHAGDMVHLRIMNQHILVVGNAQLATELLEKRSANTSDRPLDVALELYVYVRLLALLAICPCSMRALEARGKSSTWSSCRTVSDGGNIAACCGNTSILV